MQFSDLKNHANIKDHQFDLIYPIDLRKLSPLHFTPVEIAKTAAKLLNSNLKSQILDIGAGAGKFCTIGSVLAEGFYTGVEENERMVQVANKIIKKSNLTKVEMILSNVLDLPFSEFTSFYFFNSFSKFLDRANYLYLDQNQMLYKKYTSYVKQSLDGMPVGTRVVTYFSEGKEIPDSYAISLSLHDHKLKLWIRK